MSTTLKEDDIELLGGSRPSPFDSLSKILKGFCDPESSVREGEDDEEHDDINSGFRGNTAEKLMNQKAVETEIADDSTSPMSEGDESSSLVQDQDFSSVSNEEKEVEPVKVASRSIQLPEDSSTPIEEQERKSNYINQNEGEINSEIIVGTKQRSFDIVADSGRKKRVNRILDTAFYSLLGVMLTIFTLRMFGRVAFDFKPILHADVQSFPVNFNIKRDEVVIAEDKAHIGEIIAEDEVSISENAEENSVESDELTDDTGDIPIEQQSCNSNHEGACEAKEEPDNEKAM